MGICGKMFIINLHNLQMLFMLKIKYKFSECLVPLHKCEVFQWKIFWRCFCPGPLTRGAFGGVIPKSFCPPEFCCAQKNLFWTYEKHKNLPPIKMQFPSQTLKPGYGPGSAKIVSEIGIFCFEGHSAWRCSMTWKTFFYKSPLGRHL